MNGKVSKMLRAFRRRSDADKRIWQSLNHLERGAVRWAHGNDTKLVNTDYLPLTPVTDADRIPAI